MGVKGCWTCRERKVRCDLRQPKCVNCTKARRVCQGYGTQLSWPRGGDKKRAMVSRNTDRWNTIQSDVRSFLNSSSWDVMLARELENGNSPVPKHLLQCLCVPSPARLSPVPLNQDESRLLAFFNESKSLVLGPTDDNTLAQFISRIALSNPSEPTNPVLQGVLALASLQLHGNLKSFNYKYAVVTSVKEPANWPDEKTLLQNLVAMMLLYHYEASLGTTAKTNWVVYFCAVKRIINESPIAHKLLREEYSVFLDWYYYHEVLAEFTIRHWVKPYTGCGFAPLARSRAASDKSGRAEESIGCPTEVLELIAHACTQAINPPPSGATYETARVADTDSLEQSILRSVSAPSPDSATTTDRKVLVSDLHKIASLLYVNRAVHKFSGIEYQHRRLVKEGIALLTKLRTCQNSWPLFIIACEANTDDQRLAILDVLEQTRNDKTRRSNHISFIQHLVEAVWNQHDLDEDNQVDYLNVFDAVIGGVPFMPLFA